MTSLSLTDDELNVARNAIKAQLDQGVYVLVGMALRLDAWESNYMGSNSLLFFLPLMTLKGLSPLAIPQRRSSTNWMLIVYKRMSVKQRTNHILQEDSTLLPSEELRSAGVKVRGETAIMVRLTRNGGPLSSAALEVEARKLLDDAATSMIQQI